MFWDMYINYIIIEFYSKQLPNAQSNHASGPETDKRNGDEKSDPFQCSCSFNYCLSFNNSYYVQFGVSALVVQVVHWCFSVVKVLGRCVKGCLPFQVPFRSYCSLADVWHVCVCQWRRQTRCIPLCLFFWSNRSLLALILIIWTIICFESFSELFRKTVFCARGRSIYHRKIVLVVGSVAGFAFVIRISY